MPLKQKHRIGKRVLIDLGVGLAIIGAAALLLVFTFATGIRVPSRWVAFLFFTPFIFWFVARQCRRCWHQLSFWLAIMALLAAHIGLFTFVLTRYPEWPPVWFAPISIVEIGLLSIALDKLMREDGVNHARGKR